MSGFPFEKGWGVGFRLKEKHEDENKAGDDQGNPLAKSPADSR